MGGGGGGDTNPKPDPWISVPSNTNQNPMPTGGANALLTPAIQYAQQYMQSQLQGLPQVTQPGQGPQPTQQQIQAMMQRLGTSQSGKAAVMQSLAGQLGSLTGKGGTGG